MFTHLFGAESIKDAISIMEVASADEERAPSRNLSFAWYQQRHTPCQTIFHLLDDHMVRHNYTASDRMQSFVFGSWELGTLLINHMPS